MIDTVAALDALANPERAAEMAAYHKGNRRYLGVSNPVLNDLTKAWRRELSVEERVTQADLLWQSNSHEGRIAAAKLLTQARIKDDGAVWDLICSWVPQFDAWAIADHACSAGSRRLVANPSRLDVVETWTTDPSMWVRRAALVITLPWTKQNHPTPLDEQIRDRVQGWAVSYVSDKQWFIQKSIAWWMRELSKHDPDRVTRFLDAHGDDLKPFARREAAKHLTKTG